MLETLVFIATNLAAFYVMYWVMQNDGASRIEDQTGLLRMKPGDDYTPVVRGKGAGAKARRRTR